MPSDRAKTHFDNYVKYKTYYIQGKVPSGWLHKLGFGKDYGALARQELVEATKLEHPQALLPSTQGEIYKYGLGTPVNIRLANLETSLLDEIAMTIKEKHIPSIDDRFQGQSDAIPEISWLQQMDGQRRDLLEQLLDRIGKSLFKKTKNPLYRDWAVSELERLEEVYSSYSKLGNKNPIGYWLAQFYLSRNQAQSWFSDGDKEKAAKLLGRNNSNRCHYETLVPLFKSFEDYDIRWHEILPKMYRYYWWEDKYMLCNSWFANQGLPLTVDFNKQIAERIARGIFSFEDIKYLRTTKFATRNALLPPLLDGWVKEQLQNATIESLAKLDLYFFLSFEDELRSFRYTQEDAKEIFFHLQSVRQRIIDKQCELLFQQVTHPETSAKAMEKLLEKYAATNYARLGNVAAFCPFDKGWTQCIANPAYFWLAKAYAFRNKPERLLEEQSGGDKGRAFRILEALIKEQQDIPEKYQDPRPLQLLTELHFDAPAQGKPYCITSAQQAYDSLYTSGKLRVATMNPANMEDGRIHGKTPLLLTKATVDSMLPTHASFEELCLIILENIQLGIACSTQSLNKSHVAFAVKCIQNFNNNEVLLKQAKAVVQAFLDRWTNELISQFGSKNDTTDLETLSDYIKKGLASAACKAQFEKYFSVVGQQLFDKAIKGDKKAINLLLELTKKGVISKEFAARFHLEQHKVAKSWFESAVDWMKEIFSCSHLQKAQALIREIRSEIVARGEDLPPTFLEIECNEVSPGFIQTSSTAGEETTALADIETKAPMVDTPLETAKQESLVSSKEEEEKRLEMEKNEDRAMVVSKVTAMRALVGMSDFDEEEGTALIDEPPPPYTSEPAEEETSAGPSVTKTPEPTPQVSPPEEPKLVGTNPNGFLNATVTSKAKQEKAMKKTKERQLVPV